MHQVSIYTLEAKTSHRISEAKCTESKAVKKIKYNGALRTIMWKKKRGGEKVHSAGQGYTCK